MNLNRKIIAGLLAASAVSFGIAHAQGPGCTADGRPGMKGVSMQRGMMDPGARAEQRLTRLKGELKLSGEQEPLWLAYADKIRSPWFQVYPDLGNLSAWGNHVPVELAKGIGRIAAVHIKDTLAVTPEFPGQFRDVPFGTGCVDFPAAFRALKAMDYRGCFLVEMWTDKAPDPVAECAKAREWVLARMAEGGLI